MSRVAEYLAVYRFFISCILAAVGGIAIFFGYRLFTGGAGLLKSIEKLNIKNREFNVSISGMSAGATLMLTSVFWGYWSYSSIPRLKLAGNDVEITQSTPDSQDHNGGGSGGTGSGQLLASNLKGANVVGPDNENIGNVADILLDKYGKVSAYVVGLGGFLGLGPKDVAVAPDSFQILPGDRDSPFKLKLTINKDQLKSAAEFKRGSSYGTIQ
jgi:hypothetical protein